LVAVDTPSNLRRSLKKRVLKVEFKEEELASYKEKIIELINIKYNTSPALWKIGTDQ